MLQNECKVGMKCVGFHAWRFMAFGCIDQLRNGLVPMASSGSSYHLLNFLTQLSCLQIYEQ